MILLDSAKEDDARQAKALGWVKGITTNPTLLAQAGQPPAEALARLARLQLGPLFYQLVTKDEAAMLDEAARASEIIGPALVLKIPPFPVGYRVIARSQPKYTCALTAVYSPAQALAAAEAGARYVIVYVNRATRLMGDGIALVESLADVLVDTRTEIIAASIKSAEEAAAAVRAGAQHLTVPFDTLLQIMHHPLSDEAVRQFDENGAGL